MNAPKSMKSSISVIYKVTLKKLKHMLEKEEFDLVADGRAYSVTIEVLKTLV
jgi:hypothetical protein